MFAQHVHQSALLFERRGELLLLALQTAHVPPQLGGFPAALRAPALGFVACLRQRALVPLHLLQRAVQTHVPRLGLRLGRLRADRGPVRVAPRLRGFARLGVRFGPEIRHSPPLLLQRGRRAAKLLRHGGFLRERRLQLRFAVPQARARVAQLPRLRGELVAQRGDARLGEAPVRVVGELHRVLRGVDQADIRRVSSPERAFLGGSRDSIKLGGPVAPRGGGGSFRRTRIDRVRASSLGDRSAQALVQFVPFGVEVLHLVIVQRVRERLERRLGVRARGAPGRGAERRGGGRGSLRDERADARARRGLAVHDRLGTRD